ncbi:hypothetical protein VNO77_20253 [Canavalia gladiata]|uniref:Uncharacterized protein n=1 Tax=Canavalia gladiata TaxID=3824 RepID=A0AAN9QM89_CANGL
MPVAMPPRGAVLTMLCDQHEGLGELLLEGNSSSCLTPSQNLDLDVGGIQTPGLLQSRLILPTVMECINELDNVGELAVENMDRTDDAPHFLEVIKAAEDTDVCQDLVKYPLMVRQNTKESKPRVSLLQGVLLAWAGLLTYAGYGAWP